MVLRMLEKWGINIKLRVSLQMGGHLSEIPCTILNSKTSSNLLSLLTQTLIQNVVTRWQYDAPKICLSTWKKVALAESVRYNYFRTLVYWRFAASRKRLRWQSTLINFQSILVLSTAAATFHHNHLHQVTWQAAVCMFLV